MMFAMGLFWLAVIVGLAWLVRDVVGPRQAPVADEPVGAISLDE